MKIIKILTSSFRVVLWLVLAVVLLVTGVVLTLYSPWGQDYLREKALIALNKQEGVQVEIDSLRLTFPLNLELRGVMMAVDGDTMVSARSLNAGVRLLPLLKGQVAVDGATLTEGYYRIGTPDSAMYMQIKAQQVTLKPTKVQLSTMDIDVSDGKISHGCVSMILRPDTTETDTTTTKQTMKISIHHLGVEDLTYKMSMMPTIDSLGTNIGRGQLCEGVIDLQKQIVSMRSFKADSLSAAYIAPATTTATTQTTDSSDDSSSEPWTITIDTIAITNSQALYTTRGVTPQPGLDFAYIQAHDMDMQVLGFYNQATTLRLPLTLKATERCGVSLDAKGEFMLNATSMIFKGFEIDTKQTHLNVDGMMGMGDMTTDPYLPLRLKAAGAASLADLRQMFPGYGAYLALLPKGGVADVAVDIDGAPSRLNISNILLAIKGCARLQGKGVVENIFNPDRIAGDIALKGNIINVKSILDAFVSPGIGVTVPPMTLDGNISYHPGITKGNLKATTLGGDIALKALYNSHAEGYDIDLETDKFPVNAFMNDLGVGKVTMSLQAKGQGFDLFSHAMHTDITANIKGLEYDSYNYTGIKLNAQIADGNADVHADVDNNDIHTVIDAKGNLSGGTYDWKADIDGEYIDLYALKFATEQSTISLSAKATASISPKLNEITADVTLDDFSYITKESNISMSNVIAHLMTNDTVTNVDIHNQDLMLKAWTPYNYTKITDKIDAATALALDQIKHRAINVDTLQKVLPRFDIDLICGSNNMLTDMLAASDMTFEHLTLCTANDTTLSLKSTLLGFKSGTTLLDTINVNLDQQDEKMRITASINNRKGNMDNWAHVTADGMLNHDRVSLRLIQQNSDMQTGFDLGAFAALADSSVTARIFPLNPMIGYRKWTVNLDNYVYYNFFTHRIAANLLMKGDKSSIELYSDNKNDSIGSNDLNDVVLKIGDIHIQDWISFNPFAPPISGNLSANMRVKWDGGNNINGDGKIALSDFYYDKQRVATMEVDMNVETNLQGRIRAAADVLVDGERTMRLAGNLNDSITGSPFNLDFTVVKFPLRTVNPFLPADVAQLSGTINGELLVSGDSEHPLLNGEIYFTDAAIKAAITNTRYKFSDVHIPVNDNIVKFDNFNIQGMNENPLYVNGTVDIRSLTSPQIDLNLKAKNMMLVNTQKAQKNAAVFGKAYIDLDADVKGNMRFMSVEADLKVLSGTNVSYVLTDETSSLSTLTNEGLVKFVNLNDTAAVAAADSIVDSSLMMALEAQLTIQNGTTIVVMLPSSPRDKVTLQPQGTLNYSMSPMSADGRLLGRIVVNEGMVRYTLPVIGEKTFNINSGSYVAFNGDILNPVLSLQATDPVKTNVTLEGQNSRMVNFDIIVDVTGTLEQMDVKFDLTTNDDLSVANELQSMSPEQRASQAMNMLLYNVYTGPGSSSSGIALTANPLFSFLESQINNWAAQNIHGVDLSFGIDQYNQTTNGSTSSAMSYSYQVSKTLFNDRFKILVGGNYTTDNNADENIAENLINDISFEYYLNNQQTMLLKLFRHMGYESIVEGEVTQTGVGFVYRRKVDSLVKVLPKFMRPRKKSK